MLSLSPTILIFCGYAVICLLICGRNAHVNRVAALYFAGFLLLPNQDYALSWPSQSYESTFAYWYIGGALPSDTFFTKALVVPTTLGLCLFLFRFGAIKTLRINFADVCIILWIFAPALNSLSSTAYLAGTWGSSWLIGRTLLQSNGDRRSFAWMLVLSTSLLLPFAVAEMIQGPFLYDAIYQAHPFTRDGAERYIGFRPMLFFENGNQFGLWTTIAAVASFWFLFDDQSNEKKLGPAAKVICIIPVVLSVTSQSMGAIALGIIASVVIAFWRYINFGKIILTLLVGLTLSIGVVASGVVPLQKLEQVARNTLPGQKAIGFFRSIGRGSLPWRISQDMKTIPKLSGAFGMGTGQWDWWRSSGTRPWGMHQLIVGQFGIIGLLLSGLSLCLASIRTFWSSKLTTSPPTPFMHQVFAALIAIAYIDAFLNSFIFYPIILMSAALANTQQHGLIDRKIP
jgi:hypothetical protein